MLNWIFRLIHKRQFRSALKRGLQCGKDFKCQGGVSFGSEPYLITIGNHVSISSKVIFVTHDGRTWVFRENEKRISDIGIFGPITIRDNCFIGIRSIILPNVIIGPNSVVGAGSVVTKNIPPNSVWAGVPARHISTLDEYIEKCCSLNQNVDPLNKERELRKLFKVSN